MPEGHLIHHYARLQSRGLPGARTISSPQGRFEADRVTGVLVEVEARGKHLFHHWSDDQIVHIHLGRVGLFLHHQPPPPDPRPQVRMRVVGPSLAVDLIGPSTCELIDPLAREAIVGELGPDPLDERADPERVWKRLSTSDRPVGAVLLDQRILAGVGNVFRAEVLNLVGIHPERRASGLGRQDFDRLWEVLVRVMRRSLEEGRIVTVPDDALAANVGGAVEGPRRLVYRRERCGRCDTPLEALNVGGRRINACNVCQPG